MTRDEIEFCNGITEKVARDIAGLCQLSKPMSRCQRIKDKLRRYLISVNYDGTAFTYKAKLSELEFNTKLLNNSTYISIWNTFRNGKYIIIDMPL